MKRWQLLAGACLVGLLALGLNSQVVSQPQPAQPAEPENLQPAFLKVMVPIGSTLEVEGIKTNQIGETRRFMSPPLAAGKKYEYTLKATFTDNGNTVVRERKIQVVPGQEVTVDLRVDVKEEPKKEAPKKEEPKKEDPKKEMKKEEPKKEEKKTEPKKEEPKKEEPKKEVKKEEPKKEEPKKEMKKEEPKKEEPKKVEPKEEKKVAPKEEMKKEEPKKVEPKEEKKVEPKKVEPKEEPKEEEKTIVVPYVPTPNEVVDAMLKLADVKEGETVYDLGCGDGRIVISAVKKYKAKKGLGLDLNPERVKDSITNAKKEGVDTKVDFKQGDVLKLTDLSEANVVTLYLLPEVNLRLMPVLKKTLKPGSRIVSHDFDMGDWKPEKEIKVTDQDGIEHTVYLWKIPAAKSE